MQPAPLSIFRTFPSSHPEIPCPLNTNSSFHPLSPSPCQPRLCFLSMVLNTLDTSYKWNYLVVIFLSYLILHIVHRFIHVVEVVESPFFKAEWYNIVFIYFADPMMDTDCSHILGVNNTAVNIDVNISLRPCFQFLWVYPKKWDCWAVG